MENRRKSMEINENKTENNVKDVSWTPFPCLRIPRGIPQQGKGISVRVWAWRFVVGKSLLSLAAPAGSAGLSDGLEMHVQSGHMEPPKWHLCQWIWIYAVCIKKKTQHGPNLSQLGANMGPTWANLEPTCAQDGPRLAQVSQLETILRLSWGLLR